VTPVEAEENMHTELLEAILERLEDGRLPCNQAFAVAFFQDADPQLIGALSNDHGIRISRCQLGLFGYGPKAEGKHKIVHPMEKVPERLAARLRATADSEGLTCAQVWEVADALGYRRLEASSAVEAMGLKVTRCQLGCFPRPEHV
jgi:hypothetical protein